MAVVLTAALITPLGFHAHTVDQLEAWQDDWAARAADSLSVELMNERRDMRGRHLWYFDPEPVSIAPVVRARSTNPRPDQTLTFLGSGVEQWRELVAYFWPAEHVDRMLRIMACESGGDPNVPNEQGSGALGLFQIMPFWQNEWPGDYTDPWTNAAVAYQIWLTQGYAAWVCRG